MSSAQPPTAAGAPTARPRGRQTAWDMVRSMALVLAGVFAVVLLVPEPGEPIRQPVDVAAAAERASSAGAPAAVPELPDGWRANAARYGSGPADVPTWHVGYVTPTGRYAGVEQTADANPKWLDEVTSGGVEVGSQPVAGGSWRELLSEDGQRRSLVAEAGGVVTVVTGTALLDELAVLAAAVSDAAG